MCYSVQPRDRIFVKGYGFLSFAKNMGKNIVKNITKTLSGKYSQKLLDCAKNSARDALKSDFVFNKIADTITKVSKHSQQNNSEKVTNKHDKERYISSKERQKIIDNLIIV